MIDVKLFLHRDFVVRWTSFLCHHQISCTFGWAIFCFVFSYILKWHVWLISIGMVDSSCGCHVVSAQCTLHFAPCLSTCSLHNKYSTVVHKHTCTICPVSSLLCIVLYHFEMCVCVLCGALWSCAVFCFHWSTFISFCVLLRLSLSLASMFCCHFCKF